MRAAGNRHGRRGAALLPVVLVTAALVAAGCGGDGDNHAHRSGTRTAPAKTPAATATPRKASGAGPPRTIDAILRAVSGRRIRVDGQTVRVDPATVTCGGSGKPVRQGRGHEPEWTRFSCIQPTFPKGSVAGPDLLFVVEAVGPRRLVVTRRYLTKY